jgi:hypothetical protein
MAGYRITIRNGPVVEHEHRDELAEALAVVERRGRQLEKEANAESVGGRLIRRFEPVQQVVARVELSGPGRLRAGVDVRGDGSSESWTGRVRRRLVEQWTGESPYDALGRVLGSPAGRR